MSDYWSTPAVDHRDEWHAAADIEPTPTTAYDCEPGPSDAPDARLRPDPWLPFTCSRCGDEDHTGMPQRCQMCGYVNYGGETA